MPKFPARVHPILARNARTAVIIRRGPSKAVCIMFWDRGRDEFKLGQWLRGCIYEHRYDLSPDGKHFLYFAMNGKWDSPVKGSWKAISRTPYLTQPPFSRPPIRPNGSFSSIPQKANSCSTALVHSFLEFYDSSSSR